MELISACGGGIFAVTTVDRRHMHLTTGPRVVCVFVGLASISIHVELLSLFVQSFDTCAAQRVSALDN